MAPEPVIFISHKHSDRGIASELHKFLDRWSLKRIRVFQSSDPLAEGPRLGNVLSAELKQALWDAGVVLLIYTTADQDWSWCMWECGVATKPGSVETRVIVLQCGADQPKVYADHVRVDVRDAGDVLKFVRMYLTDPQFFPGRGDAVASQLSADGPEVREAADELYARLKAVIPKGEVEEWPVQPVLHLEAKAQPGGAAQATDFDQAVLVREMDPRAWHIFGLAQIEAGMPIGALVQHWVEQSGGAAPEWAQDIREQVARAATGELAVPRWARLKEVDGNAYYGPILTRVRKVPARDVLEFDVSLVPLDAGMVWAASNEHYQQAYVAAFKRVSEHAPSLIPYLLPVARRRFQDWTDDVRELVSRGILMSGPERLEITRSLVDVTRRYVVVEPMVSKPRVMHSRDWITYYDSLRERPEVDKQWILCAREEDVKSRIADVEDSWKFRQERGFRTMYCSPRELKLATGRALPDNQVIEDLGRYIKLLELPGGAYTAGEVPNELVTTFRDTTPEDRSLLTSIVDCAEMVGEDWLKRMRIP